MSSEVSTSSGAGGGATSFPLRGGMLSRGEKRREKERERKREMTTSLIREREIIVTEVIQVKY
jgi:hypothetical protein